MRKLFFSALDTVASAADIFGDNEISLRAGLHDGRPTSKLH